MRDRIGSLRLLQCRVNPICQSVRYVANRQDKPALVMIRTISPAVVYPPRVVRPSLVGVSLEDEKIILIWFARHIYFNRTFPSAKEHSFPIIWSTEVLNCWR